MGKSTLSAAARKAASLKKPREDFPLTPRADGRWAKKVIRKVYIFSGTADEAEAEWDRVKASLKAGQTPLSYHTSF